MSAMDRIIDILGIREEIQQIKKETVTMVLYKFQPVPWKYWEEIADLLDIIKFGWTTPIIVKKSFLLDTIRVFKDLGINIMNGGTLIEFAYSKKKVKETLEILNKYEFDYIEVSAGSIMIPVEKIQEIIDLALDQGFKVVFELGEKKYTKTRTITHFIELGTKLLHKKIEFFIIEGRESGRNTILFDDSGRVIWDNVLKLVEVFGLEKIMFEAPRVYQQAEFINAFGPYVKLGNIAPEDVVPLVTLRLGIRGDTFLFSSNKKIELTPSAKFTMYILEKHGPSTIERLTALTGLPERTVRESIKILNELGYIKEVRKIGRKKIWALQE